MYLMFLCFNKYPSLVISSIPSIAQLAERETVEANSYL